MKQLALVLAAGVALSGCVTVPAYSAADEALVPIFDPAEHEPFGQTGSGVLKGQAFLRQQGGGVVTCAGSAVGLVPATYYFHAVVRRMYAGAGAGTLDPKAAPLFRRAQCDAQGNFSFSGLPEGKYYVGTDVRWSVGYQPQGGALMREVIVTSQGETQVLLTDADRM